MVENSSQIRLNVTAQPVLFLSRLLNERVLILQVLVGIFLYVNSLMIVTFLKKEAFRTDTRYILFAQTLVLDSLLMVLTDLALLFSYVRYAMSWAACVFFCMFMMWCKTGTPLTLVAMCLERYVAICMPLRHADISTARRRLVGLVVIWTVSFGPPLTVLYAFLSSMDILMKGPTVVCSAERLEVEYYVRIAVLKFYFLCMTVTVIFTYFKIVKAANAVASNNKKSSSKGQKTVLLHAIQLLLCLIQFISPFVESTFMQVNFRLYIDIRYFNFVVLVMAPRCLSPLVYGLRDENFFSVLKCYAVCGLNKRVKRKVHQTSIKA